jgi:hypothetical protein
MAAGKEQIQGMKAVSLLLLTGALQAGEIEGTVWYDSQGKVAVVDGPASTIKAPEPFVPHWVKEEERREIAARDSVRPPSYSRRSEETWGWSYPVSYCRFTPCVPVRCAPSFRGFSAVIR